MTIREAIERAKGISDPTESAQVVIGAIQERWGTDEVVQVNVGGSLVYGGTAEAENGMQFPCVTLALWDVCQGRFLVIPIPPTMACTLGNDLDDCAHDVMEATEKKVKEN